MNQIMMYSFRENNVRVEMVDNEPWFIAGDICEILEINNTSQALSRLDERDRNTIILNEGIGNGIFH